MTHYAMAALKGRRFIWPFSDSMLFNEAKNEMQTGVQVGRLYREMDQTPLPDRISFPAPKMHGSVTPRSRPEMHTQIPLPSPTEPRRQPPVAAAAPLWPAAVHTRPPASPGEPRHPPHSLTASESSNPCRYKLSYMEGQYSKRHQKNKGDEQRKKLDWGTAMTPLQQKSARKRPGVASLGLSGEMCRASSSASCCCSFTSQGSSFIPGGCTDQASYLPSKHRARERILPQSELDDKAGSRAADWLAAAPVSFGERSPRLWIRKGGSASGKQRPHPLFASLPFSPLPFPPPCTLFLCY